MSKQTALAFIENVNHDSALRERVNHLADLAALIHFAEEVGYRFTEAEWNEAVRGAPAPAAHELSACELEQVAGGGIEPTPFHTGWVNRFAPRFVIAPCI
jgi:predicted ribosomally synthesized peptide with nif11-like leader